MQAEQGDVIWIATVVLAMVAAYAVLNLMIGRAMKSGGDAPYWALLMASGTLIYMMWLHPVRIEFA